jgi:hypothetical protein
MKISYSNNEMIVDLTESGYKDISVDEEIIITKKNFLIPILKGVPKNYSYYKRNKVNAHYLNCTCKEYRDNIKLYPLRDIRRICKHIFFIITKDYNSKLDPLSSMLLAHRFWDKIVDVYEIYFFGEKLYVSSNSDQKFFRVYRKNSEWKFYTFIPDKKMWANDLPPYKTNDLNTRISEFLLNIQTFDLKSNKAS